MTIIIPPKPCLIPDRPAGVETPSSVLLATAQGVGVWLSERDYRAVRNHEVDWNAFADEAKRCEVKP